MHKVQGNKENCWMENLREEMKGRLWGDIVGGALAVKENSAEPSSQLVRSPAVPARSFPRERAEVSKFTAR